MEQGEKYFVAKITSDLLDNESGKVKKVREEKLVLDWRITSITESKIDEVIK
jgi:hypothetical protein